MRKGTRNFGRNNGGKFSFSESDGLEAGDSIGNRQRFSENRINADDIGNRLSSAEQHNVVRDDIGNSIGSGPTHHQSGILISLDARNRRRRDQNHLDSRSPYSVGGVNPVVSGSQALLSMFTDEREEELQQEEDSAPRREARREIAPKRKENDRRNSRNSEKAGDSSDRWLKRLLEFDDDERQELPSNADPKLKAKEARAALTEIFDKGGVLAAIGTEIVSDPVSGRSSVLVSFEDFDLSEPKGPLSQLFGNESLALLALNFLVNKIVNRVPEERVRVQVALRTKQAA